MIQRLRSIICKNKVLCEGIVGFLISVALWLMFGIIRSKEFLLAGLLMAFVYVVLHFGLKYANSRRMKFALILAIPFSFCFELGQLVTYGESEIRTIGFFEIYIFIMLSMLFAFVNICVMHFVDKYRVLGKQNIEMKSNRYAWLRYSLVIFMCWLVMFLIFFPGFISVDSAVQIAQTVGERGLSNWHPVLHTLFLSLFINVGVGIFHNLTVGIAMYTIVQMAIVAAIYGYVVDWVIRRSGKKWIGYILLAFFAINHVIICYSITMWKDILFSSVFLLLILKVYDFIKDYKRGDRVNNKRLWLIILLSVLVAFLRNGGVLIIIALGLSLLIYYKIDRGKILFSFIGAVVFILVVQGPIYKMFGITGSPFMESMSVPAQQIGYVASMNELTEDEKTKLSSYVDLDKIAVEYSPMNGDYAKNCFDYDIMDENKLDFLLTWFSMVPRHFSSFVKAYVLHTYAYWYIQGNDWTLSIGHEHDHSWLKAEYKDIALLGNNARVFITKAGSLLTTTVFSGWMNTVGMLCWGIVYVFILFIYQRRYNMLVVMACILIYILSLLVASPISLIFRYVYALLLVLPVLAILLFCNNKIERRK